MTSEPLLSLRGVSAFYGRLCALRDVDLDVRAGESLAIIGPNGAGKSTLLRAISGLMVRRQGRITFAGREITALRPDEIVHLGVVQVPEGRRLFAPLTVDENLEAGALRLRKAGRNGEVKEAVAMVLELFPRLAERRSQVSGTLSGGEQQMLAIGRALLCNPQLLLLDEATEGLAPLVVREIWRVVSTIRASGVATLIVDRNYRAVLAHTDRALVLEKGLVVMEGSARKLEQRGDELRLRLGV